ncbi:unnamed protein product [marine sediment metagenome]|uniref:Uncharacterized protein n=1 Tax=marine sediment metagenome TaxID=412755 RepID=X0UIF0_9ZZZZ
MSCGDRFCDPDEEGGMDFHAGCTPTSRIDELIEELEIELADCKGWLDSAATYQKFVEDLKNLKERQS